MKSQLIEPRIPGGFQDFPPAVMLPRQKLFDTIRRVYESFGYLPLETSPVEFMETLTGGKPSEMRLYSVGSKDEGDTDQLALRFDLTVPLARFVAANRHHIPWPFRRYQMGPVWRGERRQKGRYNQFWQCDVDIIGTTSQLADVEIVSLIDATIRALGVERFTIHLNNRKLLNTLPAYAGFPEAQLADVLRTIDKHDKLGLEEIMKILITPLGTPVAAINTSEGVQIGIGLTAAATEKLRAFLAVPTTEAATTLIALRKLLGSIPVGAEGLAELEELLAYLTPLKISPRINPVIVRGLGYYSGPIFETTLDDLPSIGSVCSGGRYDGLVNRFADFPAPAVGMSVGIDRLLAAMDELKLLTPSAATATVGIAYLADAKDGATQEAVQHYVIGVAETLRKAGIATLIYVGDEVALAAQLGALGRADIPIAVILGSDELANQVATVKHLTTRVQEQGITLDKLPMIITKLLRL